MIAAIKGFFKRRREAKMYAKFCWIAEQLELHMLGRSDEAMSPVMALAGDVINHWDEWSDDQMTHFVACGEYLAEELGRPGFRASLVLKGAR